MTTTIKLCSVENCNKKRIARGLCCAHYQRFQRYGDPLGGGPAYAPPGEGLKFLEKIIEGPEQEDCILWPFGTFSNGYGSIRKGGRTALAHRLALILFTGVEHRHLEALHGDCNNPSCVNPFHLSWGTHKRNMADKKRDGTSNLGESHNMAKLKEADVPAILQDSRLQREIAADYGVGQTQISRIKTGRNWAHLTAK